MDAQIAVVAVIAFSVASLVVILVSLFGTKEKTYEDALAEQREHTNVLLGPQSRPKPKDKKQKKAGKKTKEKQHAASPPITETVEDSENAEATPSETSSVSNSPKANLHVEFQKPTVIEVSSEEIQIPHIPPKQKHVKKVRPILVQKEEFKENPIALDVIDVIPANNFEKIHPKDEFELIRSRSNSRTREDSGSKQETLKEKQKVKQNASDLDSAKDSKPKIEQETLKETKEKSNKNKQNQELQQESGKERGKEKQNDSQKSSKKNKPKEVNNVQSEKEKEKENETSKVKEEPTPEAIVEQVPVQNVSVTHSAKDKKKKKNEIHLMQQITGINGDVNVQLLLDAVRTAELSRSEVQILIDLLLNKQHEAPPDSEWSEGKADPVQKLKKQLAEKEKLLVEEQEALASAQAKLREVRAEQQTEKSQQQQRIRGLEEALQAKHLELQAANNRVHTHNQKIQQLQAQLNEEAIAVHKLHEEQGAWAVQRQQLEMRLAQTQEAEATIVQLRNDIQELQNRNNQLTIELHSLNDQSIAAKEHQQGVIVQLQHQLNCFKNEVDQKDDYIQQLEESRRDLEHHLNIAHRQENELKVEVSQLKSALQQNAEEVRRLEHGKGQAVDELKKLEKQVQEYERKEEELHSALTETKSLLEKVEKENEDLRNSQQSSLSNEIKDYQGQIKNLQNDLKTVTAELQENQRKHGEEINRFNNQVNQLQTDLNNARNTDEKLILELNEYKTKNSGLLSELEVIRLETTKLNQELDEQKAKNNELRQKNWKVVEALTAAENKLKPLLINTSKQTTEKEILQRVVEQRDVRQQTDEFKPQKGDSEEISKLQAQIANYKSIIDNTEGVLKRLESHIEQEELTWRKQLKAKESEIEILKQKHLEELKGKVAELELQLASERSAREKLNEDYKALKNKNTSNDTTTVIEKLSEEVNRLTEQLDLEKRNNLELLNKHSEEPLKTPPEISNGCEKTHNGAPKNGSPLIAGNSVSSTPSSNASSLNEVSVKRKNKRHRKRKPPNEAEAQ